MKKTIKSLVVVGAVSGMLVGLAVAGGAPVWVAVVAVAVYWVL